MTDFDAWLSFAVGDSETMQGGEEGGWNGDDPSPQNPTWRGIEYNEACSFLNKQGMADETFRSLVTRTVIGQIAGAQYWDRFHVALLPSGPNVLFMDGVFNGGGVANLQTAMNIQFAAGLTVDGDIGPRTLAAMQKYANAVMPPILIRTYVYAAEARYRRLASFPRYGAGWLGRLHRCEDLALKLAGAPAAEGE